jgi:hypothetical protein
LAFDYKDAYWDPQEGAGTRVDVHKTTRSVWQRENGARYLAVVLWGWDERQFVEPFEVRIDLDTTGDSRPDYGIGIDSGEDGSLGCGLYAIRGSGNWDGAMVDGPARATGCRVLYRHLTVTKRIGWRVTAQDFYGGGGEDDAVPDGIGWIYR